MPTTIYRKHVPGPHPLCNMTAAVARVYVRTWARGYMGAGVTAGSRQTAAGRRKRSGGYTVPPGRGVAVYGPCSASDGSRPGSVTTWAADRSRRDGSRPKTRTPVWRKNDHFAHVRKLLISALYPHVTTAGPRQNYQTTFIHCNSDYYNAIVTISITTYLRPVSGPRINEIT